MKGKSSRVPSGIIAVHVSCAFFEKAHSPRSVRLRAFFRLLPETLHQNELACSGERENCCTATTRIACLRCCRLLFGYVSGGVFRSEAEAFAEQMAAASVDKHADGTTAAGANVAIIRGDTCRRCSKQKRAVCRSVSRSCLFFVRPSSKGRPRRAAQCIAATRLVSGTGTTTSTCMHARQAKETAQHTQQRQKA